jgi:2-polyprenyl-3-methyl-5-hydroxy-6-metoxy-1,4-benzoquinol methylase
MNDRIGQVKSFFAQPEQYLEGKGSFNIHIRSEVVGSFIGDKDFRSILDIGCGNGAISLPLLRPDVQLTLLDVSDEMLSIARSRIPREFSSSVELINEGFMHAKLRPQSYDLILCLGVLAHVDSPADVIAKIVKLLKPNGSIIVQNTDSQHPVRYMFDLRATLRNILPRKQYPLNQRAYPLNRLSHAQVMRRFVNQGLKLSAIYRYNVYFPGMAKLFTHDTTYNDKMYKFTRHLYGTCTNNNLSWLGIEAIYHFRKLDTSGM